MSSHQVAETSPKYSIEIEYENVPVGYKKTEVGTIPVEWKTGNLDSLSEKIMVGIASAATHAYRERGIPLLRNQNIKPNFLHDDDILFVHSEYESIFKNKRLKTGDLITARTGYPGTTCRIPEKYDGAQSFTTLITRLKNDACMPEYVCFYMNSEAGSKFFELNQIGGGQKNVNAEILKKLPLPLPSLREQAAIAKALSDVDALITSLEKLIAKKRDIKTATMQQLLTGKKRLPPFDKKHTGYKQTELGEIPEDWEVGTIGDSSERITKGTTPMTIGHSFVKSGITFIKVESVEEGGVFDRSKFVYIDDVTDRLMARSRINDGDLLISIAGALGRAIIVPEDVLPANTNQALAIVRFRKSAKLTASFTYHYTKSRNFIDYIDTISSQGAQPNLSLGDLSTILVPIPNKQEQSLIVNLLSKMENEIVAFGQRLKKIQQIKQGMMQELLTGRTRLI